MGCAVQSRSNAPGLRVVYGNRADACHHLCKADVQIHEFQVSELFIFNKTEFFFSFTLINNTNILHRISVKVHTFLFWRFTFL